MENLLTSQETRANQRASLLALLKASAPDWVPIRDVAATAGFQYGARIFELRRLGYRIENEPGRAFRLITPTIPEVAESGPAVKGPDQGCQIHSHSLFGDLSPDAG